MGPGKVDNLVQGGELCFYKEKHVLNVRVKCKKPFNKYIPNFKRWYWYEFGATLPDTQNFEFHHKLEPKINFGDQHKQTIDSNSNMPLHIQAAFHKKMT